MRILLDLKLAKEKSQKNSKIEKTLEKWKKVGIDFERIFVNITIQEKMKKKLN